jgi:5-methylthioadenosine/S-adenosylhomocysteine deaminase
LFDILITNGTIVTMDARRSVSKNGAIGIEKGRIMAVGDTKRLREHGASKILDAKGKAVFPGLINTHTHLFQGLFKGLGDDVPLYEWFKRALAPYVPKLTEEDCHAAALLGCVEAIRSGNTCLLDFMYVHPRPQLSDAVIKAMDQIGIRGIFARGIVDAGADHGLPKAIIQDLGEAIEDCERLIEKYNHYSNDRIRVWLAPASIWMSTVSAFKRAKATAKKRHTWITWHASETKSVVNDSKKMYGKGDAGVLASEGVLDEHDLSVHNVWLTERDIASYRSKDVKISHCPAANMYVGDGVAPVPRMVEEGITVSLGTDGAAGYNNDMIALLKFTALLHKVNTLDPTIITAPQVVEFATIQGARAVGWEKEIGSIEVGKKADLILLDFERPSTIPVYDPVSSLVYGASQEQVDTVIIDGRVVMKNRVIQTVNQEEVVAKARKVANSLMERGS